MRVLIQLNEWLEYKDFAFEPDDKSCLDLVFFIDDHVGDYYVLYDKEENNENVQTDS